jgi:hypothetical protein
MFVCQFATCLWICCLSASHLTVLFLLQWHSAPIQNTEFWLEFCHGWPLVISNTSCKVQILYNSSLCWELLAVEHLYWNHTYRKPFIAFIRVQNMNPRPSPSPKHTNQGHCSSLWHLCSVLSQPMHPLVPSRVKYREQRVTVSLIVYLVNDTNCLP